MQCHLRFLTDQLAAASSLPCCAMKLSKSRRNSGTPPCSSALPRHSIQQFPWSTAQPVAVPSFFRARIWFGWQCSLRHSPPFYLQPSCSPRHALIRPFLRTTPVLIPRKPAPTAKDPRGSFAPRARRAVQSANRLAHLYLVRELLGCSAWLVNLYFLNDPIGPVDQDDWKAELINVKASLGLTSSVPFAIDVFLPALPSGELP